MTAEGASLKDIDRYNAALDRAEINSYEKYTGLYDEYFDTY